MHQPIRLFNRVQERQGGIYKNLPLTSKELIGVLISSMLLFYITPVVIKHLIFGFYVMLAQLIVITINIFIWILWALYLEDKPRLYFVSPLIKLLTSCNYIGRKEQL